MDPFAFRGHARSTALAAALLLVAACSPAPAAPTATTAPKPAAPAAASPAASPVTKPSPQAQASPSAAAAAPNPNADAVWRQTVEAAEREGTVVVLGTTGPQAREALADDFMKAYPKISVDFTGAQGAQNAAKVLNERGAGQYLADVAIMGQTDPLLSLMPVGAIDPVEPALILPEVADKSKWMGNKYAWVDEGEKYIFTFFELVQTPFAFNPNLVKQEDIKSYYDLLDPKWRGKLVMRDPTNAGPGNAMALFFFTKNDLGTEFMRRLFTEQDVLLLRDDRQILDMVARGERPVTIAPSVVTATDLIQRGLPLRYFDPAGVKEGSYVIPGFGVTVLINRAPHPNAARVYLNWLLSKEGQTSYARATGYMSRRVDVPIDHVDPALLPKPGVSYIELYKETYGKRTREMTDFLATVIKQ